MAGLIHKLFHSKRLDDIEKRIASIELIQADLKKANEEILNKLQTDLHKAVELQEKNEQRYSQYQKDMADYFDFNK
jgi:hypothetical protein